MKSYTTIDLSKSYIAESLSNIPGGVFVYRAEGKEEILYANEQVLDIFECDSADEFKSLTGGTFKGMIYPDDWDKVENSIRSQIDTSEDNLDHVKYRIKSKTGKIKYIEDYGRLFDDEDEGKLFIVFIVDEDVRNMSYDFDDLTGLPGEKRFLEYADKFLGELAGEDEFALEYEYAPKRYAVVFFNTTNFKFYNVKYGVAAGDEYLQTAAHCIKGVFKDEFVSRFSDDHFVVLAEAEGLEEKICKVHDRMTGLKNTPVIGMKAGIFYLDNPEVSAREASDKAKLACDLIKNNKDYDYMVYKNEMDLSEPPKRVKFEDKEILTAFAQEYLMVFEVDLRKKRLSTYKYYAATNPELDTAVSNGDYEKIQEVFINTMVAEKDRKRIQDLTSLKYVKKYLRSHKSYSSIYKSINNMFVEVKIIRADFGVGEPRHVVIGFANRTDEMVEKLSYGAPLKSIIDNANYAMSRTTDPDAIRKYLEIILSSADELLQLIDGDRSKYE